MPKLWLIGAGVFLAALLAASVIVAVLEKEETLPEGTPEAALQSFLKAVETDDLEAAYDFLSGDLKAECSVEKFLGTTVRSKSELRDERITLLGTKTIKDTVLVTVRVTQLRRSGPFGTSESSFEQRFTLRQEEDQWRFVEYPRPFFECQLVRERRPPEPVRERQSPEPVRERQPPEPVRSP